MHPSLGDFRGLLSHLLALPPRSWIPQPGWLWALRPCMRLEVVPLESQGAECAISVVNYLRLVGAYLKRKPQVEGAPAGRRTQLNEQMEI